LFLQILQDQIFTGHSRSTPVGQAKRVAVLIPGTQTPQDCVTDLKALPVKVLADGRCAAMVQREDDYGFENSWIGRILMFFGVMFGFIIIYCSSISLKMRFIYVMIYVWSVFRFREDYVPSHF